MLIHPEEILETIKMVTNENLDIRTVTMGISLRDCCHPDIDTFNENIYEKITTCAKDLVKTTDDVQSLYGIPIINKRISVTPIAIVAESCKEPDLTSVARTLDRAAHDVGIDFIGGFSALVQKGMTPGDLRLINSVPQALASTKKVCSSINVATTKAGINMDAVALMGRVIKETAHLTRDQGGIGCAKFVVFANAPDDNPFMAGAFHGIGEPECTINVGVSGPGVVNSAVRALEDPSLGDISECIKKTAFKITRVGEVIGKEVAKRLDARFGVLDLSLAPTPAIGDSVAAILEAMGLESCGTHGTTAALALLNDAVKKGGSMASSSVGGLSGAFIPVSEDAGMINAVLCGSLSLDKLEAMTSVCSVGLDMIAIPGDTPASTISAIIADEMAIGMINKKTTAVRLIPVPGKTVGDMVEFGGLLGRAPVMSVNRYSSEKFIARGGRIPAPIQALTN
ncbi:MAG: PFL family protein [Methanolobus sp.]|uniref:PFL family protein n=1 Tax=Methanolobus sp. TaxID=1874737 RepID=UPI002731397F|nr:PFL family protein [Methanolobus sp.]MDP2218174.1 PFL family protein [Methanolobus sp.]